MPLVKIGILPTFHTECTEHAEVKSHIMIYGKILSHKSSYGPEGRERTVFYSVLKSISDPVLRLHSNWLTVGHSESERACKGRM